MRYLDGVRIQRPTGQTGHKLDFHFYVIVMLFLYMYIRQFFFHLKVTVMGKWY